MRTSGRSGSREGMLGLMDGAVVKRDVTRLTNNEV